MVALFWDGRTEGSDDRCRRQRRTHKVCSQTGPSSAHENVLTARLRVGGVAVAFRKHLATGNLDRAWPLADTAVRLTWARGFAHGYCSRHSWSCLSQLAGRLAMDSDRKTLRSLSRHDTKT